MLPEDQPNRSGLKVFLFSAIIILMIGILVYLFFDRGSKINEDRKAVYADSLAAYNLGYANGYTAGQKSGYQAARQLYSDSLSTVQGLLINCMGNKMKKPVVHHYRKAEPKKETAYITAPNQFAPSTAPTQQPAPSVSIVAPTIPNVTVNPQDGEAQIINYKGKLCYIFNKDLVANFPNGNYYLNGPNGQLFVLYKDNYMCFTDITYTSNMQGQRTLWNVFIGNNPTYGYPMYIPHENVKPYLIMARGTESGIITSEDVVKISQYLPAVKNGNIVPNGDYVTGGDGLKYGGWNFVSIIK